MTTSVRGIRTVRRDYRRQNRTELLRLVMDSRVKGFSISQIQSEFWEICEKARRPYEIAGAGSVRAVVDVLELNGYIVRKGEKYYAPSDFESF